MGDGLILMHINFINIFIHNLSTHTHFVPILDNKSLYPNCSRVILFQPDLEKVCTLQPSILLNIQMIKHCAQNREEGDHGVK